MRSLPDELAQAQRDPTARRYIEVKTRDFAGSAPRPRWTRVYTGAEADAPHAVAIPDDGSLIRLRIDGTTLYRQRVIAPDAASDYSGWTSWRTGSRLCAIAGAGAELSAFTVDDATSTQIYESVSSDNGATWSSWAPLFTAAGTIGNLAAAAKFDGTCLLLWSAGATLYRAKRSAGSWGSAAAWPNTVNTITGVAVAWRSDFNIILTGTEQTTTNPTVWQLIYGDGFAQAADTWSGLTIVTPASAGANVVFDSPFLVSDGSRDWLSYTEQYTGTGGYNRPWWSHSVDEFADGTWREPVPFNLTHSNGLALAWTIPYLWATTPGGVWRSDHSGVFTDLSKYLRSFTLREREHSSQAAIVLDGAAPNPTIGVEVHLNTGYRTKGAGPAAAPGLRFSLAGWERTNGALTLYCTGGWETLAATRPRSSYQWLAGTKSVAQLAGLILARAGFHFGYQTASDAYILLQPGWTIHPGQDLGSALRGLLEKVEDRVRFNLGSAVGWHPQSGDATVYSYGPSGHKVIAMRVGAKAPAANYVHALAGTELGEAIDWASVADTYGRAEVERDTVLTNGAEADERAAATLRKRQMEAVSGVLTVRANVAQELYDVIEITDARVGLVSARRRVIGITWKYGKGEFVQEIEVAAP